MSGNIFNGTRGSAREVDAVLDMHPIGGCEDRKNHQGGQPECLFSKMLSNNELHVGFRRNTFLYVDEDLRGFARVERKGRISG